MRFMTLWVGSFAIGLLCVAVQAKDVSETEGGIFRSDITVSISGPWIDKSRSEVTMKLAGSSLSTPRKFDLPTNRSLVVQIYKPNQVRDSSLPVILFSGGWGEDFRLYSTVLKNISARGYIIVNIDHYYYQNSQSHPPGYDEWVKDKRKNIESLSEVKKQELFMKTKVALLDIYRKDILFVMDRLPDILKKEPNANLGKVVLMGHSIGGNADKSVIEELAASENSKNKVKAFVSFDSRLNQLGLKTSFEVPTLVLGAFSWYTAKNDPLRQLPPQGGLKVKILSHTTHVSFDDFSIFSVLERDLESLKSGMNEFARQELAMDIQKYKNGNIERFGEQLFLGDKKGMIQFVNELSTDVDDFIRESDNRLPASYLLKVDSTPDLRQSLADAKLPYNGVPYCGPVALVENWLVQI